MPGAGYQFPTVKNFSSSHSTGLHHPGCAPESFKQASSVLFDQRQFLILWLGSPAAAVAGISNSLPNIVIILTDDQAARGRFWRERIQTPNLDRLAHGGPFRTNFPCGVFGVEGRAVDRCYPDRIGIHGVGPRSRSALAVDEMTLAG
jgi:hypothetical protein